MRAGLNRVFRPAAYHLFGLLFAQCGLIHVFGEHFNILCPEVFTSLDNVVFGSVPICRINFLPHFFLQSFFDPREQRECLRRCLLQILGQVQRG